MERGFCDSPRWSQWDKLSSALRERTTPAAEAARVAFIRALDDEDTNFAEEAQAILERYPDGVLEPLLREAPGFGRFGRLCAIELFTHLQAREAEPVLIGMLEDEDTTVRDWAAGALAELGSPAAVPALQRAYDRWRASGEPPDWTEPLNIRRALTALGARVEVIPDRAATLARSDDSIDQYWLIADAEEVVNALADADQVVTGISAYKWSEVGWRLVFEASPTYELDYSLPWERLVESAREEALTAPELAPGPDLIVTVNWIARADLQFRGGEHPGSG